MKTKTAFVGSFLAFLFFLFNFSVEAAPPSLKALEGYHLIKQTNSEANLYGAGQAHYAEYGIARYSIQTLKGPQGEEPMEVLSLTIGGHSFKNNFQQHWFYLIQDRHGDLWVTETLYVSGQQPLKKLKLKSENNYAGHLRRDRIVNINFESATKFRIDYILPTGCALLIHLPSQGPTCYGIFGWYPPIQFKWSLEKAGPF